MFPRTLNLYVVIHVIVKGLVSLESLMQHWWCKNLEFGVQYKFEGGITTVQRIQTY